MQLKIISRFTDLWKIQYHVSQIQKSWKGYKSNSMNLSILEAIKSRTVWTAIGGLAFKLWNDSQHMVSTEVATIINSAIAIATIVFRMIPKQGTVK